MNAWFLVGAMLVTFVFGYRFYAKLLALDVFRLEQNYSTPAQTRADGRDYVPTHPHLLFAHHLAAGGGAALFTAPMAAAAWGWVPAFLWITAGSALLAGTFGLGGFWLSLRYPKGLRQLAGELAGAPARVALVVLALAALLLLAAASAGIGAAVLAAHPIATLPLVAVALIALALGNFLHGRAVSELLPACIVALLACLLAVWLLGATTVGFNGALEIAVGQRAWLSIDAVFVWVVLLLTYVFYAARAPVWQLMRPRALLTTLLLLIALLLFFIGLAVEAPAVVAPQFHAPGASASALPWLFIAIGPGALAGWHWLIVHHVTGREMRRETDATYVGYGAPLLHGAIALSALLLAITGFGDTAAWTEQHATVPNGGDIPRLVTAYIDGLARYAAALHIDTAFARGLAATVIAALALAVLEGAVRALKHLLAETRATAATARAATNERTRLWLIMVGAGLLAFGDGRGLGGLAAWPLLGLASLWLAAAGFLLIALALRALERASGLVLALAAAIAIVALWATVEQLYAWMQDGAWPAFAGGIAVSLCALATAIGGVEALRRALPKAERA